MIFGENFVVKRQSRLVFAWLPIQLDNEQYAWLEKVWWHPSTRSYSKVDRRNTPSASKEKRN